MVRVTAAPPREPAPAPAERTRADAYALLADGRAVRLRAATPEDWQLVHDFVESLGPDSLYRRFFGAPSDPGRRLADAVCAPVRDHGAGPTHGALLALLEGEVVGLADWYRVKRSPDAEVAFAVADRLHGRGVATLLAEHLLLAAERAGLRRLVAVTQGDNRTMLGVFVALGVPVTRDWEGGDCVLTIDLDLDSAARAFLADAAAGRERVADEASLRALLEPRAVVVVGDANDGPTRRLLRDLEPFPGPVYHAAPGDERDPRARNAPHPALITAPPELAVVTTPPEQALDAARRCAAWGVKALIVTAVGFEPAVGRELLEVCHEAGMRLVGPGSLGVANPRGARRLSALLSAKAPLPGPAGVAVQSGGVGLALLSHLDRLGIGVSCFAAVGRSTTSARTTCCCCGSRTRRPGSGCCTCSPSAIRASSPAPPGGSPAGSRCSRSIRSSRPARRAPRSTPRPGSSRCPRSARWCARPRWPRNSRGRPGAGWRCWVTPRAWSAWPRRPA